MPEPEVEIPRKIKINKKIAPSTLVDQIVRHSQSDAELDSKCGTKSCDNDDPHQKNSTESAKSGKTQRSSSS